ncbi:hypothetical protein [Veronia pacifica]|uniref:Outer membrane protein beta-barrel domain-containing protein n=1 Tax=Veronia pacifica TaxID=1080227 RepID=A0A1C3ER00_9GAMM|nr:hypothetical protein [Veronia pacifica]ODA35652.1 hypothetical protein A8L45_03295 [Veronia pacifica]
MILLKKTVLTSTLMASLLSLPLHAATYTSSGYLAPADTRLDVGLIDGGSTVLVEGQFPFSSMGYVSMSAGSQLEGDWVISSGVGFISPFTQFINLEGDAQIISIKKQHEQEKEFGDVAIGLSIGATSYISSMFDATVTLGNVSYGGDESEAILEFGTRIHLSEHFSVGLTYMANGIYADSFKLSIRNK